MSGMEQERLAWIKAIEEKEAAWEICAELHAVHVQASLYRLYKDPKERDKANALLVDAHAVFDKAGEKVGAAWRAYRDPSFDKEDPPENYIKEQPCV